MTKHKAAMLELTPEELLVITLQGVVAKATLLHNVKRLSDTEHELGQRAARELIRHIDASGTLNDKVSKAAMAMMMGDKYL